MNHSTTRLAGLTGSVLAALAWGILAASPAAAQPLVGRDVPTLVTLARGETGAVPWTYQNTGGNSTVPASGVQITFTAPANTTFPAQSIVPSEFGVPGSSWAPNNLGLRNCVRSNSDTTLTCDGYGVNGGVSGWPTNTYMRFSPQVTVARTAPAETTLSPGSGRLSYTDAAAGVPLTADATLNVRTAPSKPMCVSSDSRATLSSIRIWECAPGDVNQRFVIDGGKIIRGDTFGTSQEMCLTAMEIEDGKYVDLEPCGTGAFLRHQLWVVRDGRFVFRDTIGTSRETCLDMGPTRNNDDRVRVSQCSTSSDQEFVVQGGVIKAEDTL
ncbi:ricin-type beta-trefoil lectin domain protein [Streptomyces sp. NPDC059443]|uniref:ricin-type beta-trefoil lectin domain protein n=1 Tax=unclassified Streptomyces TaxID=2593676 RepID=UPI0036A8097D